MKKLSYQTLTDMNYNGYLLKDAPERVLQFGEGNFLRSFVDYFIDILNEKADFNSKVVVCQPIAHGLADMINEQDGLYTLYLRGFEDGKKVNEKRVISCISRCINPYTDYSALMDCAKNPDLRFIACNTTEAGIAYEPSCKLTDTPPSSYPAKLTQFLHKRFEIFGAEKGKGFVILACELIDDNGKELEKCVNKYADLWNLSSEFKSWLKDEVTFCSTLVDRIATGYPKNEAEQINADNGYVDNLIDTAEIFGFWVIEAPESLKNELPFHKAGLPVLITDDHSPYKTRKVRILNGAHTSLVLGAYLAGQNIVRDCMEDDVLSKFMESTIFDEIIPTLTLPKSELIDFATSVKDRFQNPFIDHELLAISLNSTSKWRARVMPSFKEYVRLYGKLPKNIVVSFAFYCEFYHGYELTENSLKAKVLNKEYEIKDDMRILEFFYAHKDDSIEDYVKAICTNTDFWGEDLTMYDNFYDTVVQIIKNNRTNGAYNTIKTLIN